MADSVKPSEIRNPVSGEVKCISLPELLRLADAEIIDRLIGLLAGTASTETHPAGLVCYEVVDMSSRQLGHRSFVAFGDNCTFKTIHDAVKHPLGGVPSRFAYPKFYALKTS